MGMFTALIYWVIVAIWTLVLVCALFYVRKNPHIVGSAKVLLVVIAIDTLRDIVENVYFGLYFGSQYGIWNASIGSVLGQPFLLVLPKILNVSTGLVVLFILFMDWFPKATRERTVLEELASLDALTGLMNRRHFMKTGATEMERCHRHGLPLTLLMVDIDHFKQINDQHGHAVGDQVIADVARLCKGLHRGEDVAARLGGEEFAILLTDTTLHDASACAERLRAAVEALPGQAAHAYRCVTVSIGACERMQGETLDTLLKRADMALYAAKNTGRNRVELAVA